MTDEQERQNQQPVDKQSLQQRILGSVRPDTSEKTGKWMMNVKEGAASDVEMPTVFDEAAAAKFPDDMKSWIDNSLTNSNVMNSNTTSRKQILICLSNQSARSSPELRRPVLRSLDKPVNSANFFRETCTVAKKHC